MFNFQHNFAVVNVLWCESVNFTDAAHWEWKDIWHETFLIAVDHQCLGMYCWFCFDCAFFIDYCLLLNMFISLCMKMTKCLYSIFLTFFFQLLILVNFNSLVSKTTSFQDKSSEWLLLVDAENAFNKLILMLYDWLVCCTKLRETLLSYHLTTIIILYSSFP